MKFRYALLPFTLSFLAAPFAGAMIASIGGEAGHNTDPTEDFLGNNTTLENITEIWNRTVTLGAGTGTYLGQSADGKYWVLTANHVGWFDKDKQVFGGYGGKISAVTENGTTVEYSGINPSSKEDFEYFYNQNGSQADLKMFSFSASGDLADYLDSLGNIDIYTGDLYTNTPLYCVGTGLNLEIGNTIEQTTTRKKQWAKFYVDEAFTDSEDHKGSFYTTEIFQDDEDSLQAGSQDSGSGVFVESEGSWELRAIAVGVGPNNTALKEPVGYKTPDNTSLCCETYFLDIAQYASQIYAIIPEPSAFGLLAGIFALGFAGTRRRRKV